MMIHIYKHKTGYDFAFIKNGHYVFGSNQGYERISGCYKAIRALIKFMGVPSCKIQNDVTSISYCLELYLNGNPTFLSIKPKKKYQPNK